MKRVIGSLIGLALFAAPAARAEKADARAITESRMQRAAGEVREFRAATGALPASREGLEGVVSDPSTLVDGWGHPMVYLRVAGGYWLMSWGADGAPGGRGDAADVVHMYR